MRGHRPGPIYPRLDPSSDPGHEPGPIYPRLDPSSDPGHRPGPISPRLDPSSDPGHRPGPIYPRLHRSSDPGIRLDPPPSRKAPRGVRRLLGAVHVRGRAGRAIFPVAVCRPTRTGARGVPVAAARWAVPAASSSVVRTRDRSRTVVDHEGARPAASARTKPPADPESRPAPVALASGATQAPGRGVTAGGDGPARRRP